MDSNTLHAALPYIVGVSVASLGVLYLLNKGVREVQPKPANYFSIPIGQDDANGTAPRRNMNNKDGVSVSPVVDGKELKTLFEVMEHAAKKFADRPCVGSRPLVKIFEEKKVVDGENRVFTFPQLGAFKWTTYKEFYTRICNFGSGLRHIGMKPKDFLAIFEETRAEWTIASRASYTQNMVVFTVYANLGEEALVYALNQGDIQYIIVNQSNLKLLNKIASQCSSLKQLIVVDRAQANEADIAALTSKGLQVSAFEDVEKLGASKPLPPTVPAPDDLASIQYTSGSTGAPKGVMLTHLNIVAAINSLRGTGIIVNEQDVILHYLPLAHSFAFMVESVMFCYGVQLGYGSPRTLSPAGVRNCEGDIKELRPTILIAVPAIYEKIKHGVLNRVNKAGAVKKTLFNLAFKAKLDAMRAGSDTPFWNRLVFNTLKENVGGRVRVMITGSAPLSGEVHDFIRVCFGAPLLQGYGLTETVSSGAVQHVEDFSVGRIGGSTPPCELKLVDCPDMGYTHKDSEGPRGEIWIRGPTIALGYYKQEDKTKEAFIDGWFATGDIGKLHPDGSFQIIDRKKHLVKPPHGEYISLEKLESVYRNCPLIESICVYVDGSHYHCVAMLVPNREFVIEWAQKNGKTIEDFASWCKSVEARKLLLHELQLVGRKFGLKSIETIRAIRLYSELWTPQNKFLTAAMKLNRTHVVDILRNDIKDMYQEIVE